MREIKKIARRNRLTVAEWVRQVLRARRQEPLRKKLAVVRTGAQHAFPTGEIEQMLAEIEKGYLVNGRAASS